MNSQKEKSIDYTMIWAYIPTSCKHDSCLDDCHVIMRTNSIPHIEK